MLETHPTFQPLNENHLKFGWGLHTVLLMCCSCAIWAQWLSGKSIQLAPYFHNQTLPLWLRPSNNSYISGRAEQNKHHPCLGRKRVRGNAGTFLPWSWRFPETRKVSNLWSQWKKKAGKNGLEYVQLCSKPTAHTEFVSPMSQHYPSTSFHYYKETSPIYMYVIVSKPECEAPC